MINCKQLKPNGQGIILGTDLIESIFNNQPIVPIDGAIIEGNITLNSVNYEHKLVIRNTTFKGHFDTSEAEFHRSLDLSGCTFEQNINFCDAQIHRNLLLTKAKIEARNSEFHNLANFERIYVQGALNARGLQCHPKLNFNHSLIGKLMFCSLPEQRTELNEDISLIGAKILHQFDCNGAKIAKELILQGAEIQGDLFCNTEYGYCTEFGGNVFMVGIKILGRADFSGAKIGGDLNLEVAEIKGALDLKPEWDEINKQWYCTEINGDVNLGGAKISPSININGTKIKGDLSLQIAQIRGNVFCQPDEGHFTEIDGKVDCTGVYVSNSMTFNGTTISSDLELKGAEIKGDLHCRSEFGQRTIIEGKANLVEMQVLGSVDFSGAKIAGDLNMKRAEIKSKLDCEVSENYRTEIGNNLNLAGAKITGSVNFSGAKVGKDLVLKGAQILGGLECRSYTQAYNYETEIGQNLNLIRAKISSSVDLLGAKIQGYLELEAAEIDSNLFCNLSQINLSKIGNSKKGASLKECKIRCLNVTIAPANENAHLNLEFTKVIKLKINESLPKKGLINLEGFEFQQIELPEQVEKHVNKANKSLDKQERNGNKYIQFLEASTPFDEGAYFFMENWLRNQGAELDANRIYTEMRRRNRREKVSLEIKPIRKWKQLLRGPQGWRRLARIAWIVSVQQTYDWILDFTICYGTATNRLFFFYFLPVLMFSWILFNNPQSVELDWDITTGDLNNPQVIERLNLQKKTNPYLIKDRLSVHPEYGEWKSMDAFWQAIKVTVPIISLTPTDKWTPSDKSIMCWEHKQFCLSYYTYAKFITLFGWITVPLFLAGASGIVKKKP
jgi:hypothetical protein